MFRRDEYVAIICLCFNKYILPEDWSGKLATLVSHIGQTVEENTFNPSALKTEVEGSL